MLSSNTTSFETFSAISDTGLSIFSNILSRLLGKDLNYHKAPECAVIVNNEGDIY